MDRRFVLPVMRLMRSRQRILVLMAGILASLIPAGLALTQTVTSSQMPVVLSNYINPVGIHPVARDYLYALGNRLTTPGNERITYQGTYTDSVGTTAATLIWQVPGYLKLSLTRGSKTYYIDPVNGIQNLASLSTAELNALESLGDDSPEAFLYTITGRKNAYRFLGARFRTDNGKTPNYAGPWYDIFDVSGPLPMVSSVMRQKFYHFDSQAKLFVRNQYQVKENGAMVGVQTEYSNWTTSQGYPIPGQILRRENGNVVFTVKITSAVVSQQANDGTFPGH
jgi:hypothetical protein